MTLLSDPEIQPALRWIVLLLLCLAGWLWSRGRHRGGACLFLLVQCGALLFWTMQIREPLGFSESPAVQGFWARVSVAQALSQPDLDYVRGMGSTPMLSTRAAAAGLDPGVLKRAFFLSPIALVLSLALVGFGVGGTSRRRSMTAALSSTGAPFFALAGDPFALALHRPQAILLGSALLVLAVMAVSFVRARRPVWLAAATVGAMAIGSSAAGPPAVFDPSFVDWFSFLATPVAALLFVPVVRRAAHALRSARLGSTAIEAIILVSLGAGSPWFWWDPPRTVAGFEEARSGTRAFDGPVNFLRSTTPHDATVATTPVYAGFIAAGAGRQVLLSVAADESRLDQPYRRNRLLESLLRGEPDMSLSAAFGVTHLVLGPGDPEPPGSTVAPGAEASGPRLRRVYEDANNFRIFELVPD